MKLATAWGVLVLAALVGAGCRSADPQEPEVTRQVGAMLELVAAEGPETTSLLGEPLSPADPAPKRRAELEADLAEAQAGYAAHPADEDSIIWLGRRLAYLGRYRDAIAVFSHGLALHPDSFRLLRHRGHRRITLRQFAAAERDLARAGELARGWSDELEPDGAPNRFGIPRSTTQSNIWYHLGLARYLQGDFEGAAAAYAECLEVSRVNDDMLCATTHWYYMTLRRLGRDEEAAQLLEPIRADMEILENDGYHQLLLMYRAGQVPPELAGGEGGSIESATVGYGVGNWYQYTGQPQRARAIFAELVRGAAWPAFGHIAAEADLARLRAQEPTTSR